MHIAKLTWLTLFAIYLSPVVIMFIFAGVISIYSNLVTWLLEQKEEVDHEI
ncbi:hypothetical protein [Thalassotalea sp. G2M2-11]|uniref:hypothetical protein n=1 Tax=Thalassotalea sp. G2M2-11 TaxID=2787627 RepID=UPI0019D2E25B|nr:hypothetical protein [Thalassotalea sp. G2M2-11]